MRELIHSCSAQARSVPESGAALELASGSPALRLPSRLGQLTGLTMVTTRRQQRGGHERDE